MQLGLTKEQLEFRLNGIGGSEANMIMSGDNQKVMDLWLVKTKQAQPEDLSSILPVQMGSYTEPFNRYWYEKVTGNRVTNDGETRISFDYSFMMCTLDGITHEGKAVWEAKHVSAFAKEEEILERYMPQLTHNMLVCGVETAVLSVFFGNHKHFFADVKLDKDYADQLITAETEFWRCVKNKIEPVIIVPKYEGPVERKVDMTGNNAWASAASDFVKTQKAAKDHESAKKLLKELVEPDVKEAYGHGIIASRSSNGAITIKGAK